MSIAQNLIDHETVEFSSKKHWIAPVRDSVPSVLLLIGAYLINVISPDGDGVFGAIGNLLDLIRTVMIVVAISWIGYNFIVWRTAEFAVTNLRVIREEGLVSRRSSATMISSVSDVQAKVGLFGKQAGYGDISIFTQSGSAGADRFTSITKPEEFRNAILTRRMAKERGVPVGAAATAATPSASASRAPAATPASSSSADAAAALATLSDLRDRNLITPEEYESKRAEVLARI